MAKFLRIGVHHSNVSGYTSKAWSAHRFGKNVILKWGAVEVRGAGRKRQIFWLGNPRQKTIRCGTEERAQHYVRRAISRRLEHQYERLSESLPIGQSPSRHKIRLGGGTLATILFVDIVRSTEKAARMGDIRWAEVMNHYYAAIRKELRAARGKEANSTGDGVLATFLAPINAVQCAVAIRAAVRTLGLEIRTGLHSGEYNVIGGEHVGISINIGARVAAKARASEILMSSAVKDLLPKAEIALKDVGLHSLKGVPNKWRLYLVDSL